MRILALETSTRDASVAVLEGGQLLGETGFPPDRRTAEAFAPSIAEQLRAVGWQARDVQLIVVSQGPGSFTGLRVGVTAAKTLAYATGAELLGVNTLAVIARQAGEDLEQVEAVMDAQRQQLFVARFRCQNGRWAIVGSTSIVDNDGWLTSLETGQALVITGPGLSRLQGRLPAGVRVVPPDRWLPRATAVGSIGWQDYQRGHRGDLWKLVPQYYRQSAAEEKATAAANTERNGP